MKERDVEKGSLEDLEKILMLAEEQKLKIVVIGGWAVRAYTSKVLRYTKDIDITVVRKDDLQRLRKILERVGYKVRERPYGLSGYRKVRGVAIVVNGMTEEVESVKKIVNPFYPEVGLSVKAKIASVEDLLVLKTKAGRERDVIDVCLLVLDSSDIMDMQKLRQKLEQKQFFRDFLSFLRKILNMIGTKKFHAVWEDHMRRKITKEEKIELWKKLNNLIKKLS